MALEPSSLTTAVLFKISLSKLIRDETMSSQLGELLFHHLKYFTNFYFIVLNIIFKCMQGPQS
jgi:hypothetical protein